jgi:dUTP pyrophosphatase
MEGLDLNLTYDEGIDTPHYETKGSAGFDVQAMSIKKMFKGNIELSPEKMGLIRESFNQGRFKLRGFERVLLGTGIYVNSLQEETELQVRSRGSVPLKRGLIVGNGVGTIDSDFRGEIGVIIINCTPYLAELTKGEKIAQLVHTFVNQADSIPITETVRGTGAYGSTNI